MGVTMAVCFVCNEDRGDLALFRSKDPTNEPMRSYTDWEPCATCKKSMETGILLFEADKNGKANLEGRRAIIKEKIALDLLTDWGVDEDAIENTREKRIILVDPPLLDSIDFIWNPERYDQRVKDMLAKREQSKSDRKEEGS